MPYSKIVYYENGNIKSIEVSGIPQHLNIYNGIPL